MVGQGGEPPTKVGWGVTISGGRLVVGQQPGSTFTCLGREGMIDDAVCFSSNRCTKTLLERQRYQQLDNQHLEWNRPRGRR